MAEDSLIFHVKTPTWPQFRFEWHPGKKIVYLIRLGVEPPIGEAIAYEVTDHGAAQNNVLIWLRGYRAAKSELTATRKETTQ